MFTSTPNDTGQLISYQVRTFQLYMYFAGSISWYVNKALDILLDYPLIAAIIINVAPRSNLVHKQRFCLSKYANESITMQYGISENWIPSCTVPENRNRRNSMNI